MPMHDWTRVDAGLYYHFHQRWAGAICDALNAGVLPADHFALVEQRAGGLIPDALALRLRATAGPAEEPAGGTAVAVAPPRTRHSSRLTEAERYARKSSQVAVRHRHGDVIAVVELVSPGNKSSETAFAAFAAFVRKSADLIQAGVHLLIVDPFPPGPRDPRGVHPAVWGEFDDDPYTPPADQPLTAAAYDAGEWTSYVEPFAVGQLVPELPLFLRPGVYVPCPLEATYQDTWRVFPAALKGLLG